MTEPGLEQTLPARAPSRPAVSPLYIAARTSVLTLKDGSRVLLRPAGPTDRALLVEGFERLSPESRYRRFFAPMKAIRRAAPRLPDRRSTSSTSSPGRL